MAAAHNFEQTARFLQEKQPLAPEKLLEIQTPMNISFACVLC